TKIDRVSRTSLYHPSTIFIFIHLLGFRGKLTMTDQQKVRFLAASRTFGCRVNGMIYSTSETFKFSSIIGSQVAGPGR
ncbi:hypothetical protein CSPAE12_06261, partial [Colletotrichum incanum]